MSGSRAGDDFATIRARLDELRRERDGAPAEPPATDRTGMPYAANRGLGRIDERDRDRAEGAPPPWVPTIFLPTGAVGTK